MNDASKCPSCDHSLGSFDSRRNTWWCSSEMKEVKEWRTALPKATGRSLLFSVATPGKVLPGERTVITGGPCKPLKAFRMIVGGANTSTEAGGTQGLIIEHMFSNAERVDIGWDVNIGGVDVAARFSATVNTPIEAVIHSSSGVALQVYNPTEHLMTLVNCTFLGKSVEEAEYSRKTWTEKDTPPLIWQQLIEHERAWLVDDPYRQRSFESAQPAQRERLLMLGKR